MLTKSTDWQSVETARWLGWLCYLLSSDQQQPFLIETNVSILYIGGKAGFFLSRKF